MARKLAAVGMANKTANTTTTTNASDDLFGCFICCCCCCCLCLFLFSLSLSRSLARSVSTRLNSIPPAPPRFSVVVRFGLSFVGGSAAEVAQRKRWVFCGAFPLPPFSVAREERWPLASLSRRTHSWQRLCPPRPSLFRSGCGWLAPRVVGRRAALGGRVRRVGWVAYGTALGMGRAKAPTRPPERCRSSQPRQKCALLPEPRRNPSIKQSATLSCD